MIMLGFWVRWRYGHLCRYRTKPGPTKISWMYLGTVVEVKVDIVNSKNATSYNVYNVDNNVGMADLAQDRLQGNGGRPKRVRFTPERLIDTYGNA